MIPEPRPWASLPSFAEGRATVSGPHLLSDRSIEKRLRRKNVDLSAVLEAVRGQGRRAENGKKTMAQLLRQVDYDRRIRKLPHLNSRPEVNSDSERESRLH
ncbi:hypothetical protein FRC04_008935 [Tulasnella sp. 424]|nr:hypothetical protein FRC04_008935 [Tulasnella sp. 424]